MEPRRAARVRRAAIALALGPAGMLAFAALTRTPLGELWTPVLVVPVAAPLAVLLAAPTAAGRWVAFAVALALTPPTLLLVPYGAGTFALPMLAALWWTFAP